MRFGRHAREVQEPLPESPVFVDPFGLDDLDIAALLERRGISMPDGQLKTAVAEIAQAMRPFVAKQTIFDILSAYYTPLNSLAQAYSLIEEFLERIIPADVVTASAEQLERFSPFLQHDKHAFQANNQDPDLTIKSTMADIAQFVNDSYAAVVTPEVSSGFIDQYKTWLVERP